MQHSATRPASATACRIYAVCNACARVRSLSLARLIRRFGRGARIADVRAQLHCEHCRAAERGVRLVWSAASAFRHRPGTPARHRSGAARPAAAVDRLAAPC